MGKVVRVLEYNGPMEWITRTLENPGAGIPARGSRVFEGGGEIKSGLVLWEPDVIPGNLGDIGDLDVEVKASEVSDSAVKPQAKTEGLTLPPSGVTITRIKP